jgi:hypothetical protein
MQREKAGFSDIFEINSVKTSNNIKWTLNFWMWKRVSEMSIDGTRSANRSCDSFERVICVLGIVVCMYATSWIFMGLRDFSPLLRCKWDLCLRREEKPTRCHWIVYCTYNTLNMFRALLCPSPGARYYMCVITAYGLRCLGCWLLEVRCRAVGYAFGMRDVARLQLCNIPLPGRIACCSAPDPDNKQPSTAHHRR